MTPHLQEFQSFGIGNNLCSFLYLIKNTFFIQIVGWKIYLSL